MRAHRFPTHPSALRIRMLVLTAALLLPAASRADVQLIAPGTGPQNAIVVSTGADGICNTAAATGDIQAAPIGQGTPNHPSTIVQVQTAEAVDLIERFFANPNVAYIHAHYARRGCFAALIERAA